MKPICILILATLAVGAGAQDPTKGTNPGSLWSNKAPDILADRTARRVGDVVTILITETSSATYSAATNATKNDATSIAKGLGPILGNLIPNLKIGADSKVDGQGQTRQSGELSARIAVVIKEVFPNGTMLVEGTKAITTNKETQNIMISGLIRREDIRPDNTILSFHVANAQIKTDGKGMIAQRQRKGILTWLVDWLF
jgi:flagellar L-ring protein precursor FlgH